MKKLLFLFISIFILGSCESDTTPAPTKTVNHVPSQRSGIAGIWSICRRTIESNNAFAINGPGVSISFIPIGGGLPTCGLDPNGPLSGQAIVRITNDDSAPVGYNGGILNIRNNGTYYITQTTGSCMGHGFSWNSELCAGLMIGTPVKISSQVFPSCQAYVANQVVCLQVYGN